MSEVREEFNKNKKEWFELVKENYSVYCASYYIDELKASIETEKNHIKVLQEDKIALLREIYKLRLEVIRLKKNANELETTGE